MPTGPSPPDFVLVSPCRESDAGLPAIMLRAIIAWMRPGVWPALTPDCQSGSTRTAGRLSVDDCGTLDKDL